MKFLLDEYMPTPIVAPWNGGSGFYEGDSTEAMEAICNTNILRFSEYRRTIEAIAAWPELPPSNLPIAAMIEQLRVAAGNKPGKANEDLRKLVRQAESIVIELDP